MYQCTMTREERGGMGTDTVVLISYFHEKEESAASIRSLRMARHLRREFGKLYVVAECRTGLAGEEGEISRESASCYREKGCTGSEDEALKLLISKLLSGIFCDSGWRWSISLARLMTRKSCLDKCTIIMATGRPFVSWFFIYAYCMLKRKRLVLDYRDSWLRNPATPMWSTIGRPVVRVIERMIVKRADLVFTASASITRTLERECTTLYNIPDETYLSFIRQLRYERNEQKEDYYIYSGTVYAVNRLSPVCKALKMTEGIRSVKEFRYYGGSRRMIERDFADAGISNELRSSPIVGKKKLIRLLAGAKVGFCTTYTEGKEPGVMELGLITTKIFDYLAVGLPTIVVSPNGSELRLILERLRCNYVRVHEAKDVKGIGESIVELEYYGINNRGNESMADWQRTVDAMGEWSRCDMEEMTAKIRNIGCGKTR